MKPRLAALLLSTLLASPALAAAPVREVKVARAHLRLDDVLPTAAEGVAALDLGPTPAPGASRLVPRDELRRAFATAGATPPATLPEAVRVVRKMTKLTAAELEKLTRESLDAGGLTRGASLGAAHPTSGAEIAAGWDTVRASVPRPPHHVGAFRSTATLTFLSGAEVIATLSVPVQLALSAEAAAFDLTRGSPVTLVVRHGLVEIEASAQASADADVGDVLPITLRPSGRVLRARLIAPDRAELVEGGGA